MYVSSRIIVGLPDVLLILASPAALALSGEATAIGAAPGARRLKANPYRGRSAKADLRGFERQGTPTLTQVSGLFHHSAKAHPHESTDSTHSLTHQSPR